jgi:DNA-binding MarR family transcriptional regulator
MVTSLYNDAFAGEGVTFAQASLLMFMFAQPGVRQTTLSQQLQIEKSAMSRDLQLLQRNGWLTDNIRQGLYLTEEGRLLAKRCHKIWKTLNTQVREQLGSDALDGLSALSAAIGKLPN